MQNYINIEDFYEKDAISHWRNTSKNKWRDIHI